MTRLLRIARSPDEATSHRSVSNSILILVVLSLSGITGSSHAQSEPRLDAAEIAKSAADSEKKLLHTPAEWRVVHRAVGVPGAIIVDVKRTGEKMSWTLFAEGSKSGQELRIVEADDVWYVSNAGRPLGKYRPFEALLPIPGMYALIVRSEPVFATEQSIVDKIRVNGRTGDIVNGRLALIDNMRRAGEESLAALRNLDKAIAGRNIEADRQRKRDIADLEQALLEGTEISIDEKTGMLMYERTIRFSRKVESFTWLTASPPGAFALDPDGYEDHSADITTDRTIDWIMVGYDPRWRQGAKDPNSDSYLLNLKTRELRRVPLRGPGGLPGSFSPDRRRVYVTGTLDDERGMVALEIDLRSGDNRVIADSKSGFFPMIPLASHDGRRVALTGMYTPSGIGPDAMKMQVLLIDLKDGSSRNLGEARDWRALDWFPHDDSLLVELRTYVANDKPARRSLVRLTLDGETKAIRSGGFARIIPHSDQILFQNEDDELWYACNFEGENVRRLGDGLRRHGGPSPAPDGRRAVFINYDAPGGPKPVLVDLTNGEVTSIPVRAGLWRDPVWK